MRKIHAAVPVLALLFGACADTTGPVDAPQFNKGVASPSSTVQVEVVIPGAGAGYWIMSGPSRNGQGTCHNGHYYNPTNRTTSDKPHAQCWVEGSGASQTITFDVFANHVQPTSGNEQLNFGTTCHPNDAAVCSDTYVHYKKSPTNRTTGGGSLYGGGYAVHLANISEAGNKLFSSLPVTVCPLAGGSCSIGTVTFTKQ